MGVVSEQATGSVYDVMGGAEAVLRLARAWHARVLADEVVSHAFSHGFRDDHDVRLAAYWAEQLGGPATFTETMGDQSTVLRMHSGNGEHQDMDRRAEACFAQALEDAALPADPRLRAALTDWFRWGVDVMDSHPETADDVPAGLPFPRWSWDGPVC